MKCTQSCELFAAHIEYLLDEATAEELASHLAECQSCQTALDETRRLTDHLRDDGRRLPVPSIAANVMDRIIGRQTLVIEREQQRKVLWLRAGVAALLLIGVGLAVMRPSLGPRAGAVYADSISAARRQFEGAKTVTWRITYYERLVSAGGRKSLWFKDANSDQRYSYKSPGVYRCESLDKDGKVSHVSVEDVVGRAKLDVNYTTRSATLSSMFASVYNLRGFFGKYLAMLGPDIDDLQSLGQTLVNGRPANGFRKAFFDSVINKYNSYDIWIDEGSKRLVACKEPGDDSFDPASIAPGRAVPFPLSSGQGVVFEGTTYFPAPDRGSTRRNSGYVIEDVVFGEELSDELFSLESPEGFNVKRSKPPSITELDVINFMELVAKYSGDKFPDRMPNFNYSGEDYDRFATAEENVRRGSGASQAETKLVESMHRWWATGIPGPGPMHVFLHSLIDEGSWKYLGKGVTLGDKSRIVCWYRPKNSRTFRVVRGDLSVEEVEPDKLPLPVRP